MKHPRRTKATRSQSKKNAPVVLWMTTHMMKAVLFM